MLGSREVDLRWLIDVTDLTADQTGHAKGLVDRERHGRAFAYSVPPDSASRSTSVTAGRMSRLLDAERDHAGVLARFVAFLPPGDQRLLAELLRGGREPAASRS